MKKVIKANTVEADYDILNDPNSDYKQTINNIKMSLDGIYQDLDTLAVKGQSSNTVEDGMWDIIDRLVDSLNSTEKRVAKLMSR